MLIFVYFQVPISLVLLCSNLSVNGRRNDKAIQFSEVVLPKTLLDEYSNDTRESHREPKLLFSTGFVQSQIGDLKNRLSNLEIKTSNSSEFPEGGVPGGYETFNDAKANFTHVWSNVTNLYEKVQANRKNGQSKCSRERCDMILNKVKKVKKQVEFLQNINITVLEEMLNALKNTSMVTVVSELKTQVTELNTNATAQQVELNSLKTKVSSLKSKVSSLQTKVSTLETTTNTNTQDIDKIGNSLKKK